MQTLNLFPLALVLHITGIALLAGGVLGSYVSIRQLWKYLPGENQKAAVVFKTSSAYNIFFGIGGALILISGFMLLRVFQFSVTKQTWFEIKIALVVFLVLNGRLLGARVMKKLQALLAPETTVTDMLQVATLRRRLGIFYGLQFVVLLLIFVLGVYKFQ